jgi:hypothetical protein
MLAKTTVSAKLPYTCIIIIIIIIGIQPLGRSGQRPEFSQATGMALVRCMLGKFLGVACHCFPPYTCIYKFFSIYIYLKNQTMFVQRNMGVRFVVTAVAVEKE